MLRRSEWSVRGAHPAASRPALSTAPAPAHQRAQNEYRRDPPPIRVARAIVPGRPISTPIRRIPSGCCVRAESGQAAAMSGRLLLPAFVGRRRARCHRLAAVACAASLIMPTGRAWSKVRMDARVYFDFAAAVATVGRGRTEHVGAFGKMVVVQGLGDEDRQTSREFGNVAFRPRR